MENNEIPTLLGKGNGISLIDHSKLVSRFAVLMAKESGVSNEKLLKVIEYGGLLHDIGKCTTSIQNSLSKNKKLKKVKYSHNEIGWSFLSNHFNIGDTQMLDSILNIVYWHHGIFNKMGQDNAYVIYNTLSEDDKNNMMEYLMSVIPSEYITPKNDSSKLTPSYYSMEDNEYKLLGRTCVISADRKVAPFTSEDCNWYVDDSSIIKSIRSMVDSQEIVDTPSCPFEDTQRWDEQVKIASNDDNTVAVNAPAGFGKTIIGLLWGFRSNKKIIWVCPRNVITESIYYAILNELQLMGINKSVQLYYGSKIVKSNCDNDPFDSDIIITNIDNYLSPAANNRYGDRLFLINNASVVFDEYHELMNRDTALFSLFITLLKTRHRLTNSKTMLLSATPLNIWGEINTIDRKVKILPEIYNHYNFHHNEKYKFNVLPTDKFSLDKNTNNLVIHNSISEVQKYKGGNWDSLICHGEFESEPKQSKLDFIYKNYGKESIETLDKQNINSTNILQAGLDISLNKLYESCLSPESTTQRIGRINRWGKSKDISEINIFKSNERNESLMKSNLYNKELSDLWFDFLKKSIDGKILNMDDYYCYYNEFNKKYESKVVNHLKSSLIESTQLLTKIYPFKYEEDFIGKENIKTAGSNKIRASNNKEIFCIYQKSDSTWTEPFSQKIYEQGFEKQFKEDVRTADKMKKIMRQIMKSGDERYDFSELMNDKYSTIDTIRYAARKSNTPYIVFNEVYDNELGIISK